jgi:site-specific DNA recombinase
MVMMGVQKWLVRWQVDAKHIYIDAGVSGTSTEKRERFQAMIAAAKQDDVNRIVAMKLDRIARNVRDFLSIVDELSAAHCDLVLVKESFDTSTPHGRFALTMFAAMAELEASTITERVMTGKAQKASEGGYNGSRCPLGYKYDNGAFTVDSSASYWVREIFTRFVAGQGLSRIADDLNAAGAVTAKGGKWYAGTVRYILNNGIYAGIAQWDGSEVEEINAKQADGSTAKVTPHPTIISRELYEQAHARLQAIKPGPMAA